MLNHRERELQLCAARATPGWAVLDILTPLSREEWTVPEMYAGWYRSASRLRWTPIVGQFPGRVFAAIVLLGLARIMHERFGRRWREGVIDAR